MTLLAPSPVLSNERDAFTAYDERGAAFMVCEYGSVFRHVGPDALDLLHRITTNSLIDLPDGAARQTILTSEKGRIIDAPWVLKLNEDELLLVSDAPDSGLMQDAIMRYTIIEDAELIDVSDTRTRIMVFGENASEVMGEFLGDVEPATDDSWTPLTIDDGDDGKAIALRTHAAGVDTWMLICDGDAAARIMSRSESLGLSPAPISLFDHLRVANRSPIAGKELTDAVNPLEAGLEHLIDFDKGCYVGQEVIARLDTYDKVQRHLVKIDVVGDSDRVELTAGDGIIAPEGGRDIGWISSVAEDPKSGERLGLGFIRSAFANDGDVHETSSGARIRLSMSRN